LQNADPVRTSVTVPVVPAPAITTPITPAVTALVGFIAHPAVVSTASPLITVPFVASLQSS
jgi:hypothetical protein